jgi:hypothetical protein
MKIIPLTKGQFAVIDDEDFEQISAHKWSAQWVAGSKSYRAIRKQNGKSILMHREIMHAEPGIEVDHRFHRTLDNRKSQLRLCSHQQNKRNSRVHRNNASGFKGVDKFKKRWRARIRIEGKAVCLGFFDSPRLAAFAYDTAASASFGEFACPNFGGGQRG